MLKKELLIESANYQTIDRSISLLWANLISIGLFVPIFLIPSMIFDWLWGSEPMVTAVEMLFGKPILLFFGFVAFIVLHEMIHGLTWQGLSGGNRGVVEYGVKWKVLTPYAHLKIPIGLNSYRWGTGMPGLLLGVLPVLIGLGLGDGIIFLIGLFMTASAGGDFTILYLLRNDRTPALVEDHPDNAGCYVLVEITEPQE